MTDPDEALQRFQDALRELLLSLIALALAVTGTFTLVALMRSDTEPSTWQSVNACAMCAAAGLIDLWAWFSHRTPKPTPAA